ncbi:hypothetical protein, partial [uncultured Paraglaciecola sp.]|uniref:hypothetical protein n=1 Tax=uncultured Paraglaciecola sp. TaxID=1765024 RepID=UPI0025EE935A
MAFSHKVSFCLLYTSDAADEEDSDVLVGRMIYQQIISNEYLSTPLMIRACRDAGLNTRPNIRLT